MAWKPDYASVTELKAHLRIADTADDTALGLALTAASRAIDYECNRQFGSVTPVAARYYNVLGYRIDGRAAYAVDDIHSAAGLLVAYDDNDDGTWSQTTTSGTDWDLWPYNALADGRPWTHLLTTSRVEYLAPWSTRGIRVTALFGWASVPDVVKQACLIQAARFFVRRDSAYGVAGCPDQGNELRLLARLDPDVALLLTSVRRPWGAV